MENIFTILAVSFLTGMELNIFIKEKQKFRLAILIPFILMIILNTAMVDFISSKVVLFIKIVGTIFVVLYYFYVYKISKARTNYYIGTSIAQLHLPH